MADKLPKDMTMTERRALYSKHRHPPTTDREARNLERVLWLFREIPGLKPTTVLDIGCESGFITRWVVDEPYVQVLFGIDPCEFSIEHAKNLVKKRANPNKAIYEVRGWEDPLLIVSHEDKMTGNLNAAVAAKEAGSGIPNCARCPATARFTIYRAISGAEQLCKDCFDKAQVFMPGFSKSDDPVTGLGEWGVGVPPSLRNRSLKEAVDHYDTIVCFEVIEHFLPEEGVELIKKIHSLLAPSGMAFLCTPSATGRYGLSNPDPWHLKIYTLDELSKLIKEVTGAVSASNNSDPDFVMLKWRKE